MTPAERLDAAALIVAGALSAWALSVHLGPVAGLVGAVFLGLFAVALGET